MSVYIQVSKREYNMESIEQIILNFNNDMITKSVEEQYNKQYNVNVQEQVKSGNGEKSLECTDKKRKYESNNITIEKIEKDQIKEDIYAVYFEVILNKDTNTRKFRRIMNPATYN